MKNFLFYTVIFFSAVAIGTSLFGLADKQYFMFLYLTGSLVVLALTLLARNQNEEKKTKWNAALNFLFYTGIIYASLLVLSSGVLGTLAWLRDDRPLANPEQIRLWEYAIAFFVYGLTTIIFFVRVRKKKST